MTFNEYYKSLDRTKTREIRELIVKECAWTAVQFYDRLMGRSKTTQLEQDAINLIAGQELEYPYNPTTKQKVA